MFTIRKLFSISALMMMGFITPAHAALSSSCKANGSYADLNFSDYGNSVTVGRITFNTVKRNDTSISGSKNSGQYIWSFSLTNKRNLKVRIALGPSSVYDAFSGSARTVWGYTCDLTSFSSSSSSNESSSTSSSSQTDSKYARPDDVEEIRLTSPDSDVWINADTGEAMMKSGSKWFYRIIDDIKDGQNIEIGILSFDEKPNTNTISNNDFNTFAVDAAVTVDGGIEALNVNIKDILKYLPQTRWYVLHMKSDDGSTAKFRLMVQN